MSLVCGIAMWLAAREATLRRCVEHVPKIPRLRTASLLGLMILASLFVTANLPGFGVAPAQAAPGTDLTWTMNGFNYTSWWYNEYLTSSSTASLGMMAGTGANWVAIVPTQYMATYTSNTIAPETLGRTATTAAVVKAIDDAHAKGLKVLLKPHIDVQDNVWRGEIQPTNPGAWFASYSQMINSYAQLANSHGVEMLVVGTELSSMVMSPHYNDWANVISQVRARYNGPLTYAASQNDLADPATVSFSGLLDYLGADMYFPLSDAANPSVSELVDGWTNYNGFYGQANWLARIEAWQSYWNKPVIFTEMGYRSADYGTRAPWDFSFGGVYNGDLQAKAFDAAFRVFGNKPWLMGVFWWNWTVGSEGGAGDTNYMVADKPAQNVVTSWLTKGTASTPNLAVDLGSVAWMSYADYRDRRLSVSYNISNSGGVAVSLAVIGSDSSDGVELATALPIGLGDLPQGSSRVLNVAYWVPPSIPSFRSVTHFTFNNVLGQTFFLPASPPPFV